MRKARIEVFEGRNKQYYYRVVARNNEIVSISESYTRKSNARRAAKRYKALVNSAVIVYE